MTFKRTQAVQQALDVELPQDYAEFLETYGTYESEGAEVYGIDDEILDIEKIPCVIGATKILRKNADLPDFYIVVHHTGLEGQVVCIDSRSGEVVLVTPTSTEMLYGSFNEWFKAEILNMA